MSKAIAIKDLKKGNTVILHMFTGIAVGVKEVIKADKSTVTLETRKGEAKFSRKTGKQVEPEAKAEKFANFITEDDGSFVPKESKKKSEKAPKKSPKKAKEEVEEVEEDEEEVVEEKPKKKAKKKVKAKAAPVVEEDEDDEDDEYEEVE